MSLRITNWESLYENAATRKLKKLAWVPIPNGADSLGFLRMREEEDFSDLYTGWVLILATASRCSIRGSLSSSDGRPYTAADLELKWRFPAERFQRTIDFCSALGWIESPGEEERNTARPESSGGSPDIVGDSPDEVGARVGAKERKEERNERKNSADRLKLPHILKTEDFREAWGDWVCHRREIKKPITKTQAEKQIKMLTEIGHDRAITAIIYTIEKGWQGIREPEGKEAARIIRNKQANQPDHYLADLRKTQEAMNKERSKS